MVDRGKYPYHMTLFLTSKQRKKLEKECKRLNMNMSDFFRMAIEKAPYLYTPSSVKLPENIIQNIQDEVKQFEANISKYISAYK